MRRSSGGAGRLSVRSARLPLCRGDQRVADAAATLEGAAEAGGTHAGPVRYWPAALGEFTPADTTGNFSS